mmetsp:Transcript_3156/g.9216  ORF Transcript_3156/g.9216 Transcript_3156/m.9216 type:complete len:217 (+) Transcript_3156:464-1114(+)
MPPAPPPSSQLWLRRRRRSLRAPRARAFPQRRRRRHRRSRTRPPRQQQASRRPGWLPPTRPPAEARPGWRRRLQRLPPCSPAPHRRSTRRDTDKRRRRLPAAPPAWTHPRRRQDTRQRRPPERPADTPAGTAHNRPARTPADHCRRGSQPPQRRWSPEPLWPPASAGSPFPHRGSVSSTRPSGLVSPLENPGRPRPAGRPSTPGVTAQRHEARPAR